MNTILNIKTNKELKIQAQNIAEELGVPLTTVVNSFLKQFVRERRLVLDIDYPVNKKLIKEWEALSEQADRGINVSKKFKTVEELFAHLNK